MREATAPDTLPSGWVLVRVKEIADLLRGVSYRKEEAVDGPQAGHLPVLRATNIQGGRLLLDSELVYVPERYVRSEQLLKAGDIVVCMSSGSKEHVGKTAQLTAPWEGSFGAFCAALRFDNSIDQSYAAFFLQSPAYRGLVRDRSSGININNLRRSDIESLEFPVAPLSEQRRIVTVVETQFTRTDAGVAALKRVQARLRGYKASVLKAACEGRLVPTEAELARAEGRAYEPASVLLKRILAERRTKWEAEHPRQRYREPEPPDNSSLPELPEGWTWTSLESCADILDSQRIPVNASERQLRTDGKPLSTLIPYYGATGQVGWIDGHLFDEELLLLGEDGAPFLEPFEDKAYIISGKTWVNNHAHVLRALAGLTSNSYLRDCLNIFDFRNYVTGTTRYKLNQAPMRRIPIPLPPRREQARITAEVERRLSFTQGLECGVERALHRADRLRQAILKRAFEGRLVPQDPNDEPASALLARIMEERSQREAEKRAAQRAERASEAQQREEQAMKKKRSRRPLWDVVLESGRHLTPIELFSLAGFSPESVDEFYEELREEVLTKKRIRQDRPNDQDVFLEAVET